jgi:branched-chain amino acid transport system ATP-binding protein
MTQPLLAIDNLQVSIQAIGVLRGFSLSLNEGQMIGLIGRNGAGKTTLLRSIMGHLPVDGGDIRLSGASLKKQERHTRAVLGIGYMPEDRRLIPELTVEENILLPIWVSKTLKKSERLDFVYGVLPELAQMKDRRALLLSGGQQKLVALARALAVGTKLLLLDEPFEGVAPALSERLSDVIAGLRGSSLSVLIAQSELNHTQSLFDREYVIERGANAASHQAA